MRILTAILLVILLLRMESSAEGAPARTFYLVITAELGSDKIEQELQVTERTDFRAVTTVGGIRWTFSGTVGTAQGDVVPIMLRKGWYKNDQSNSKGHQQLLLSLDQVPGRGSGFTHDAAYWFELRTRPKNDA